eukprot:m.367393 g.367393  ORF g.367393 m.367393 type:complete len:50 (+) comp40392_c0_seq1:85-234(+)
MSRTSDKNTQKRSVTLSPIRRFVFLSSLPLRFEPKVPNSSVLFVSLLGA